LQSDDVGPEEEENFVKSLLNERVREQLDLLRQLAPEKIIAMYQETVLKSGRELRPRQLSFSHMIDVIIEHGNDELLSENPVVV
jgi:hypothetical protein